MPDTPSRAAALERDLTVERQALQLAQRQRDDATRWAQWLCYLLEVSYHQPERITEGGKLATVVAAREAGYEPIQTEQPSAAAQADPALGFTADELKALDYATEWVGDVEPDTPISMARAKLQRSLEARK